MAIQGKTQIKYPILKNVEYFDVMKNKQTLKSYSGADIEAKKWREVSLMIGKDIGAGTYRYTFKFNNTDEIHNGTIRAVESSRTIKDSKVDSKLELSLMQLKDKVENLTNNNSSNIGVDVLISITKQSYEQQILFLNNQLSAKDNDLQKLENQIEKLNDELDQCYAQIDELNKNSGMAQYIEIAKDFLKLKIPGGVNKVSLADSNSSDIPKEILDLLGVVDWLQVDQNIINEIVKYLNMFIPKLPLKQR